MTVEEMRLSYPPVTSQQYDNRFKVQELEYISTVDHYKITYQFNGLFK